MRRQRDAANSLAPAAISDVTVVAPCTILLTKARSFLFFPVRGELHILITPRRFLRTDQEEIELNVFWAKEIV